MKHIGCVIEFGLLFIGIPILLVYTEDIVPLIPTILLITAGVIVALRLRGWKYSDLWVLGPARAWRNMLLAFLVVAVLWTIVTYFWRPDLLFSFPQSAPLIWVLVMFLYPILSAFPQEIIYRTYFFHRYQSLLGDNKWLMIGLSGWCYVGTPLIYEYVCFVGNFFWRPGLCLAVLSYSLLPFGGR